jgi:hypothetical protein
MSHARESFTSEKTFKSLSGSIGGRDPKCRAIKLANAMTISLMPSDIETSVNDDATLRLGMYTGFPLLRQLKSSANYAEAVHTIWFPKKENSVFVVFVVKAHDTEASMSHFGILSRRECVALGVYLETTFGKFPRLK